MKKRWKKLTALMTAAAMVFALAGCGGKDTGNSSVSAETGTEAASNTAGGSGQGKSTVYVEAASDPGNYQPSTRNAGATQVFLLNV